MERAYRGRRYGATFRPTLRRRRRTGGRISATSRTTGDTLLTPNESTPPTPPIASTRCYLGDYAAHEHAHVQVLLGLEGCLELEVAGRGVRVDATCGLIIPPGVRHGFASERGARVRVVDVPAASAFERVRVVRLPAPLVERSAWECLALVASSPRASPRRVIDVSRLIAALDGRLHESWPTSRMAARYALSTSRFHARWLALTGAAPQAWLRARRLDSAERLLGAGWSLERVAAHVGYGGASALGQALRRERGTGARVLRRDRLPRP